MRQNRILQVISLIVILIPSFLIFFGVQTRQAKSESLTPLPEVKFMVYPDGWISIDGLVNQTVDPLPFSSPQPTGYSTLEFGWDGSPKASLRSTLTLPNETVADFPLNSTTLSIHTKKVGDILSSQLDATVILPPAIEEVLDPLSSTDLSLVSEYEAGEINGNITVIVVGYPASTINFFGNVTQLKLEGGVSVPFITVQGTVIDRTLVEEFLNYVDNFLGRGPNSLWNLTEGLVECPSELFSNVVTYYPTYASISFEMQILGNFTSYASKMLTSLAYSSLLGGMYSPSEVDALETMMYEFLSSSLDRVQRDVIQMAYTYSDRKLVLKESTTTVTTGFKEDIGDVLSSIPSLFSEMNVSMEELMDTLLTETYASVKSFEFSAEYSLVGAPVKEGRVTCDLDVVFSGDLNEEINFMTSDLVGYSLTMMPQGYPVPWQLELINSTLMDVGRLKLSVDISESSVLVGWENLKVLPPREVLNATHFGLDKFFNVTNSTNGAEIRALITVLAGSNFTHKVSLVRPSSVPVPDAATGSEIMVWENETLSSLQDLVFVIESAIAGNYSVVVIDDPREVSEESPIIVDATNEANVTLTVTSISSPATIIVRNQTDVGKPAPGSLLLLGNYIEITSDEGVTVNATIRIDYSPEQLAEAGLDEGTLTIYYWDESVGEWVDVETHLNTEEHYAWAVIDHFSIWALFGELIAAPFWMQWWFYALIGGILAVFVGGLILVSRRRGKASTSEVSDVPSGETGEVSEVSDETGDDKAAS